jgi:hypothetical protein
MPYYPYKYLSRNVACGVDNVPLTFIFVNMKLTLDVDRLVAEFGGISRMARQCTEAGFSITKQAIARWKSAGTIPMAAWIKLCELSVKDGKIALDLRKYLART